MRAKQSEFERLQQELSKLQEVERRARLEHETLLRQKEEEMSKLQVGITHAFSQTLRLKLCFQTGAGSQ